MKALLLLFWALSTIGTAQAQKLIFDKRIQDQRDCFSGSYSDFSSWRMAMKQKFVESSDSGEQAAQKLTRFDNQVTQKDYEFFKSELVCRVFKYPVEGILINGFVIKPKKSSQNLPVLIYNRGGNGNFGSVRFGTMLRNLFPVANEGFVIIGSQYRGSLTKPEANSDGFADDEFGGSDIKDVTALLGYIANIKGADPLRVGMFGASRGGMQTFLALKQSPYIKAVASISGLTDLSALLDQRPEMERVYQLRIPDYINNKHEALNQRSVLNWVDELPNNVPILLIHGENDKRVPAQQAIKLAEALEKIERPHKLVLYPGDNHFLRDNRLRAQQEIVSWFKTYL